jgi:hypothetical protein
LLFLIFTINVNAKFFNPYISLSLGRDVGGLSLLENKIKGKGETKISLKSKKSFALDLNAGIELDLWLIRFYLEVFANKPFAGKNSINVYEEKVNSSLLFEYKQSTLFGAKAKLALNLFLFDFYAGAGIGKQNGKVLFLVQDKNCNFENLCSSSGKFNQNVLIANVGIQRKFMKKYAIYLEAFGTIPSKINDTKINDTASLIQNEALKNEVNKINSINLSGRIGFRYYI